MIGPVLALCRRDLVRFVRQRSRIVGALATPVVFWVLLGSGLGQSFQPAGVARDAGYLQFFFPGTLALIVLFTAIFSTISVIEDRQQGFLQGVLVAPVPRPAIVLGKVLAGTALAVLQAGLFLFLAPVAGLSLTAGQVPAILGVLAVLGFALTGLGFVIAWMLDSTQGFHAIMNLLLVPMWLLSGAVFPASGASSWLHVLMIVNPMTYGVAALQAITLRGGEGTDLGIALAVTVLFGLAMVGAGSWLVRERIDQ